MTEGKYPRGCKAKAIEWGSWHRHALSQLRGEMGSGRQTQGDDNLQADSIPICHIKRTTILATPTQPTNDGSCDKCGPSDAVWRRAFKDYSNDGELRDTPTLSQITATCGGWKSEAHTLEVEIQSQIAADPAAAKRGNQGRQENRGGCPEDGIGLTNDLVFKS